jgi:hypothetical protein
VALHSMNWRACGACFFARPGKILGLEEKEVWSQAKYFDPAYPTDAQFVENVMPNSRGYRLNGCIIRCERVDDPNEPCRIHIINIDPGLRTMG